MEAARGCREGSGQETGKRPIPAPPGKQGRLHSWGKGRDLRKAGNLAPSRETSEQEEEEKGGDHTGGWGWEAARKGAAPRWLL